MLPFILTIVGGYLIGNSLRGKLFSDGGSIEDLSFKFNVKKIQPKSEDILSHEIITIEIFDLPDEYRKSVKLQPYHLIFGKGSLSLYEELNTNETAGLQKSDAEKFILDLKSKGEDETKESFIAGLSNFHDGEIYCFYNVTRLSHPGLAYRIIPHESLHIARTLISMFENPKINPKEDKWWEKPEQQYVELKDESEEFFAEVLERVSAIAYDRWDKIKLKLKN